MGRILKEFHKAGLECLSCEKINIEFERFSEYRDSDEHPAEDIFERPASKGSKIRVNEFSGDIRSILQYFLDGSRKTYKISDIIVGGRYLPLIAGQVGVAVVERKRKGSAIEILDDFRQLQSVIAFPSIINKDDLETLETRINNGNAVKFRFLRYDISHLAEREPVDLGIAKITTAMHELETDMVKRMAERQLLGNDRLLVIDGPLRFGNIKDIVQFRNVIGLSKQFKPSFNLGKGRRKVDVGSITSELRFGERTTVYRAVHGAETIGMWYLRIRRPEMMYNPLQGIVKIECYAIDPEDKENGFSGDKISTVSGHLLRERNVTPYGSDSRWASHIYPVYLAETYLKSSFMSDTCFKALF